MRQEIHRLVEAVRVLQIMPTGLPAPRCIKIGLDKEILPERLLNLREALDAVDASGVLVIGEDPKDEVAKYRQAIDNLLRFQRMRGLDPEEGEEIVRTAIGKGRKRQAKLEPLPVFAPNGWQRRKKIKPVLRFEAGFQEASKIHKEANQMNWVVTTLGAAATDSFLKGPPGATKGGA